MGIVEEIKVTLELTITDLTPAIKDAVEAELDAVKNALGPLIKPVLALVKAVLALAIKLDLTVTGIQNALTEVGSLVSDIVASLGVSNLL